MATIYCRHCGKQKDGVRRDAIFCSRDCAHRNKNRPIETGGVRTCSRCSIEKPTEAFPVRTDTGRRRHHCMACNTAASRRWRNNNRERHNATAAALRRQKPEAHRGYTIKYRHGITIQQYKEMEAAQGGKCAICRLPDKNNNLSVDHCHKTGRIRGLLCGNCNRMIGLGEDEPTRLESAAQYLRWHVTNPSEIIHRKHARRAAIERREPEGRTP